MQVAHCLLMLQLLNLNLGPWSLWGSFKQKWRGSGSACKGAATMFQCLKPSWRMTFLDNNMEVLVHSQVLHFWHHNTFTWMIFGDLIVLGCGQLQEVHMVFDHDLLFEVLLTSLSIPPVPWPKAKVMCLHWDAWLEELLSTCLPTWSTGD